MLFLVADSAAVEHAVEEARRYLAIGRIIGDPQRYSQFTRENRRHLKSRADQAQLTLRIAITRLYRHLLYPDGGAPAKHHHLSHYALPAQEQGNVNRDQAQVILGMLREVGKVRTADDKGIPPLFVRQKAWPANAERVSPLRIRKEFAARVGLPVLLDINLLKEAVKLGIKAGQWLYFDPAQGCAYSKESPTSPLVEITGEVELIVPAAAGEIPICGKREPSPPPLGKCPLCGNPQDGCTCAAQPPGPADREVLSAAGSPSQAFQRVVDLARDRKIRALGSLEIRAGGEGREFGQDLQAMALAVPQLPKAGRRVEVKAAFDLPGKDHLAIRFEGSWDRYRRFSDTVQRAARESESATGHITLRLAFPSPVDPTGSEIGSIRDTFAGINPGHVEVVAIPAS